MSSSLKSTFSEHESTEMVLYKPRTWRSSLFIMFIKIFVILKMWSHFIYTYVLLELLENNNFQLSNMLCHLIILFINLYRSDSDDVTIIMINDTSTLIDKTPPDKPVPIVPQRDITNTNQIMTNQRCVFDLVYFFENYDKERENVLHKTYYELGDRQFNFELLKTRFM